MVCVRLSVSAHPATGMSSGMGRSLDTGGSAHRVVLARTSVNWGVLLLDGWRKRGVHLH